MLISREGRYIFIHIPRTGGTSISKCVVGEPTRSAHSMNFFKEHYRTGFFIFSFVRNPFDRLVSSFLHAKRMNAGNSRIRQFLHANIDISFSDFVVDFLSADHVEDEGHFRRQAFWVKAANPDFIGRFERFAADFDEIAGRLVLKAPLERRNDTSGRSDYRNYYSGAAVDKVARLYAEDIELLGYRFGADEPASPGVGGAGAVSASAGPVSASSCPPAPGAITGVDVLEAGNHPPASMIFQGLQS